MTTHRASSRRRGGFTLVELMVAFALIIFIMSVLAQAFGAAGRVVSDLKVATEMEEKLRGVMTMLRRDLAANHFDTGLSGSQRKLSDLGFWNRLNVGQTPSGFFRIYQLGAPTAIGGGDGLPTTVWAGSALHFTAYRPPDYPGALFSVAGIPAGHALLTTGTGYERESRFQPLAGTDFRTSWGEIAYWMSPIAETAKGEGLADQTLYALRRRQLAVWPTSDQVSGVPTALPGISAANTGGNASLLNDPTRSSIPAFRFGAAALAPGDMLTGAAFDPATTDLLAGKPAIVAPSPPYPADDVQDIVLSDVLSFDVRVLIRGGAGFVDLSDGTVQAFSGNNPAYPKSGSPYCFDTWTNLAQGRYSYATWNVAGTYASVPLYQDAGGNKLHIRAIQATLRIWDAKSQTTRQMTMIQDM